MAKSEPVEASIPAVKIKFEVVSEEIPAAKAEHGTSLAKLEDNLGSEVAMDGSDVYGGLRQHNSVISKHDSEASRFTESFATIAREEFAFNGRFSTLKEYPISDACNPCLRIDGIGRIGLPLSVNEARTVIGAASPVSVSGKDTGSPHLWDISADKVHFNNPAWMAFLENAGRDACRVLAGREDVHPTFKLSKLSVHEPGDRSIKQMGSKTRSGLVFGFLVVILPSLFHGGNFKTHCDVQSETYEVDDESGLKTRVVAVRHAADYELSPITSGYRLCLIYDIIEATPVIHRMPSFPDMHGPRTRLKAALQAWKKDGRDNYFDHLLQNSYPYKPESSPPALAGADALLALYTQQLVDELHLELYLVYFRVTRNEFGHYDVHSSDSSDHSIDLERYRNTDGESEQVNDCETLITAVEMNGGEMDATHLNLRDLCETAVENWPRRVVEYCEVYERAILIVVDPSRPGAAFNSCHNLKEPCDVLRRSTSSIATNEEKSVVNSLIEHCEQGRVAKKDVSSVVDAIRSASARWNDIDSLLRVLRACRVDERIARIGVSDLLTACRTFGWRLLREFLEDVVLNERSNSRRYKLLKDLRNIAHEGDEELDRWCDDEENIMLLSLCPILSDEVEWVFRVSICRGWAFFRDMIFPQLRTQNLDRNVWRLVIRGLVAWGSKQTTGLPQGSVKGLIADCVAEITDSFREFPTTAISVGKKTCDVESVMEVVRLCVDADNPALCRRIAHNLGQLAIAGSFCTEVPPWMYYLKLCEALVAYLASNTTVAFSVLEPFFVDAVDAMLSSGSEINAQHTIVFTSQHLSVLMGSLRRSRGISLLKERITSHRDMLRCHKPTTLITLGESVVKALKPHPGDRSEDYADAMSVILRCAIEELDLTSLHLNTSGYIKPISQAVMADILGVFKVVFEAGEQVKLQYRELLARLLPPPPEISTAKHLIMFHTQFAPILNELLTKQPAALRAEFSSLTEIYLSSVILSFAKDVMVQRPQDRIPAIEHIGCNDCDDCHLLREFLSGGELSISFQRQASTRTHLEKFLSAKMRDLPGVTTETRRTKPGKPHTLKITKPHGMTPRGLWSANKESGTALLGLLGDAATQRGVLGSDYDFVVSRMSEFEDSQRQPDTEPSQLHTGKKRLQGLGAEGEPVGKKPRQF
ncbi:hypothetical protein DFH09DRAFT_1282747 [Mycena vulgaris]|nr:hypothetical protein DFH09DRAFT_1282747 [Mycena vulgaris]